MNNNTLIELKHIQLELSHSRTQHMRHFIDQYFCYSRGYISRTGRANWGAIFFKENVSLKALKVKETSDDPKKEVTKEHVVPLIYIVEKLNELGPEASLQSIKEILDTYIIFATITKEEDKALRDAKLNSTMPEEFYVPEDPLSNDLFARYKKVGIETVRVE